MPRPLKPRQQRENARFLEALACTGNARLAARSLGVHRSTYTKRRAKHPAFAAAWDAALAAAQAALAASAPADPAPILIRTRSGRLQLRRAAPGQLTPEAEQLFLAALAVGNNVRRAARAAGFAHSTFHRRARLMPDFARQMALARRIGADRLEHAAMASAMASLDAEGSGAPFAWQAEADDAEIPPMTVDQVLQFLAYRDRARRHGRAGGHAPAPPTFEEASAQVMRAIQALERANHFRRTGEWRFEEE
jgi:hypothetical protein